MERRADRFDSNSSMGSKSMAKQITEFNWCVLIRANERRKKKIKHAKMPMHKRTHRDQSVSI